MMSISDQIFKVLEDALSDEEQDNAPVPPEKKQPSETGHQPRLQKVSEISDIELAGYAIGYPPLNWDDLGLGSVPTMGFVNGQGVQISFKKGKWILSGPRLNSSVMLFILAGAGGLYYFLRDYIAMKLDWGWILSAGMALLVPIINLFIRKQTLEFEPYEVEYIGYDAASNILVFSSITQPGGVVALKLNLPVDERRRKIEAEKLSNGLRRAHTGYMRIDGQIRSEMTKLKSWSLFTFLALLLWYLEFYLKR